MTKPCATMTQPCAAIWLNRWRRPSLLRFGLLRGVVLAVLLGLASVHAYAVQPSDERSLTIACAANFVPALNALLPDFLVTQALRAEQVRVIRGSSGALAVQLQHGAEFDVLLSADAALPQQLLARGVGVQQQAYAQGELVAVFAPRHQSRVAALAAPLSAKQLAQAFDQPLTVAVANPRHAPYGQAALEYLADWPANGKPKLVYGNSVLQAWQFVETGQADVALVSKSVLLASELAWRPLPKHSYLPIAQHLLQVHDQPLSQAFIDYLLSAASQQRLAALGYQQVAAALPANRESFNGQR